MAVRINNTVEPKSAKPKAEKAEPKKDKKEAKEKLLCQHSEIRLF